MTSRRFTILLAASCVLIAASASALDNNRRGFVIGAGLGWGSAKQTLETSGGGINLSANATSGGLATDFRVGAGLNERWLLYYTNQQVFFRAADTDFAQGITGAGATYFFQPQSPSLLIDFALGAGVLWNADANESDSGFGVLLGLGYEFARHFQIKADWYYTELGKDTIGETEVTASFGTFRITLNWLGY